MLDAHFIAGDGRVNENIGLTADPPGLPLRARPAGRRHQETRSTNDAASTASPHWPTGSSRRRRPAAGTASACSRPPASSPRWSTSTWSSRSSPARSSRRSTRSSRSRSLRPTQPGDQGRVRPRGLPLRPLDADRDDRPHQRRTELDNDISLLDGFLNPPAYNDGGTAGTLTPEQAAGSIIMGMSDQVGNELDEFVTDTLRNNLLGLPLDLPTINMTRARERGHPVAERPAQADLRRPRTTAS